MASQDRCIKAAQVARVLGSFSESPEALIKYYQSQRKNPAQHKDPDGHIVAIDDGNGTSSVFFTDLDTCELFAAWMKTRH